MVRRAREGTAVAVVFSPEGKRRAYGKTWTKLRALILERDAVYNNRDGKNVCECCGAIDGDRAYDLRGRAIWKKNEDGTRTRVRVCMEVDHILPFVLGGGEFDIDNLITLCRQCNRRFGDSPKDPAVAEKLAALAFERNREIIEGGR